MDSDQPQGEGRRAGRADARQNRERILAAARGRFAVDGIKAQIDDIARDAGVAAGTIYHHFGSKDGLLEAIIIDRFERMVRRIGELLRDAQPWEGLEATVRYLAERQVNDRAWKDEILAQPGLRESTMTHMGSILTPVLQQALERAQAAGLVRGDLVASDLPLLLAGLPGLAAAPADRERYLAIILAGLRA
jgi:AcrR family transcriptional regulator